MKKTIAKQIEEREYKPMPKFFYFLYHLVMAKIVLRKYKPVIVREDDIRKEKEPCFIVFNHLSRLDHLFVLESVYPKSYNMMCAYNEFYRSHLAGNFKASKIIPKKQFTQDAFAIKCLMKVFKKGGSVAIAPEGIASMYGESHPQIPGTGRLIKMFRHPVYFVELRGQHLTTSWTSPSERIGKTYATTRLLLSKEQIESMTANEIDELINKVTYHDEYEWQKEKQIEFKNINSYYNRLEDFLYKCPKCGKEFKTIGKDGKFVCEECGNGFTIDNKYNMSPISEDSKIFDSPTKWVEWERKSIIEEIRANPNYEIKVKVNLGKLPVFDTLKNLKTTEICGNGEITVNHKGMSFTGIKDGEPFTFELPYTILYTLIYTTSTKYFGTYVDGNYYEFYPEEKICGKLLLVVEEMHRYHVNTWANYPSKSYLYEGLELGVDNK